MDIEIDDTKVVEFCSEFIINMGSIEKFIKNRISYCLVIFLVKHRLFNDALTIPRHVSSL